MVVVVVVVVVGSGGTADDCDGEICEGGKDEEVVRSGIGRVNGG